MSYLIDLGATTGSGQFVKGLAAEALGDRALVHVNSVGTWSLTDAETAASMPVMGITMEPIPVGMWGQILIRGAIGLASWTWTTGGTLYASDVLGELSQTMPDMSSNVVQEIGYASSVTLIFFDPKLGRGTTSPTYTKFIHVGVETFKLPAAGAPTVEVVDNTAMLTFNQNDTEDAYSSWEVPTEYAGGDLNLYVHWTNDGGIDDNGNNVRWEINYQVMANTLPVSGSHANSPKVINDTYTSDLGRIFHTTDAATIAEADFATYHQITFNLTALAAAATQLDDESRFIALMLEYTAYSDLG